MSMVVAPFWFSTEHLCDIDSAIHALSTVILSVESKLGTINIQRRALLSLLYNVYGDSAPSGSQWNSL